jgi:hypothetical protein
MAKKPESTEPESPARQLERLLQSNGCIVYHNELPDPEYPFVRCSIFGAPKTNELFVRLSNGSATFVAVAPSPVAFPVMADRIFGIDVADEAVAFGLADQLWEQNRAMLIGTASGRRRTP